MATPQSERDPFADDRDDGGEKANDAALEKMRKRISDGGGKKTHLEAELGPEVDTEAAPEASDDDDAVGAEERASRRERRRARYDDLKDRAEAAERRAADADARAAQLAHAAIARLNQPTAASQASRPDPYAKEIADIRKEQNMLYREFAAMPSPTQEQVELYERKAAELDDRKGEMLASRAIEKRGLRQVSPQQGAVAAIQVKFPKVMQSAQALRFARGHHDTLVARGSPDDISTMEKSFQAAEKEFFGGGRPAPTDADRRRRAAAPAGTGAGGSSGEGGETMITMRKEFRQMARAAYPSKPEAEAYKLWAQGAGRRTLAKQKRSS